MTLGCCLFPAFVVPISGSQLLIDFYWNDRYIAYAGEKEDANYLLKYALLRRSQSSFLSK